MGSRQGSRFTEGEFYIHSSSTDVVIEIVRVLEYNGRYTRFEARHWNLSGVGRPWLITDEIATYRIFDGDGARDWHVFDMEVWVSMEGPGQSSATH